MTWDSPYDPNLMAEGFYRRMYLSLKRLARDGYAEPVGKVTVRENAIRFADHNRAMAIAHQTLEQYRPVFRRLAK